MTEKYSKTVYYQLLTSDVPIRKTFSIEATDKKEAFEILDKMAKLYSKKLEGESLPNQIVSKLRSVKKESGHENERLVRMLKNVFKGCDGITKKKP